MNCRIGEYGKIREELVEQVLLEIRMMKKGERDFLSSNSVLSEYFGISRRSVKKYLGGLEPEDRKYRVEILQHMDHRRKKPERGLRRLREDLLQRIVEFGHNVRIPLRVALEQSKDLARKPYDISVFRDNLFLFFLGMRQEACNVMRDCFDIVYRDVYEGTVIKRVINKLFGEEPRNIARPSNYAPYRKGLQFFSDQVSYVCMALTADNDSPPYELLTTPDKTIIYLRGFLFRGARVEGRRVERIEGMIERPKVSVRGKYKQELMGKVRRLVCNAGIRARRTSQGFAVYHLESMQRMIELSLLSKYQEEKLEGMLKAL